MDADLKAAGERHTPRALPGWRQFVVCTRCGQDWGYDGCDARILADALTAAEAELQRVTIERNGLGDGEQYERERADAAQADADALAAHVRLWRSIAICAEQPSDDVLRSTEALLAAHDARRQPK